MQQGTAVVEARGKYRNPAELLAMLAEHGWIDVGHVPGGIPLLRPLDVAGALGMAHDQVGGAMLLAKYTMDAGALTAFSEHWSMMVDRRAYQEQWSHDDRTAALATYTLAEWLDAQRCRTCKGVASQMTEAGRVKPCEACGGTGLRTIGDRPVARALSMSNEGYRKSPWPFRLAWCRGELQRREGAALSALAHRLTGRH